MSRSVSRSISGSVSSNTSSFNLLNTSRIRRKKQQEAVKTMALLEEKKNSNDMFNSHIITQKYQIDFLIDKIKLLEEEIKKIQNKKKMNKTFSVNSPSMALMSDSKNREKINDLKRQIKNTKTLIKDIETNISILETGKQNTNNEMKILQEKLNILNLSIGGRTKQTRKRRTLKKK